MARGQTFKGIPPEPNRKRRGSRDLYEALALLLWLVALFATGALAVISKATLWDEYGFTWEEMEEITYAGFAFWLLCTIALFMFDKNAKIREEKDFEYHMKNFRELRDRIIELEKQRVELELKRGFEPSEIKKNNVDEDVEVVEIVEVEEDLE